MAWMLAPRRLYGGATAIDACLDRDACLRTVLLHGLSLGLDAAPEDIDDLTDDGLDGRIRGRDGGSSNAEGPRRNVVALYTSVLSSRTEAGFVRSFDAIVAEDADVAAAAFAIRRGVPHVDVSGIDEGFDRSHPVVEALLSPAISDMLDEVAATPWSPMAAALSVSVEQRSAE